MTTRRGFMKGVAAGAVGMTLPLPKATPALATGGFIPAGTVVTFTTWQRGDGGWVIAHDARPVDTA